MRVNFEDRVYRNPMYPKLILKLGCEYKAKGMLVSAWELAQDHWLEHRGVPKKKWPADMNVLFEFGFASVEIRGTETKPNSTEPDDSVVFVYVSGSKEECKFLEAKSAAGKKGGKSRSEIKTRTLRQNAESSNHDRSTTETADNCAEAKSNHTETSSSISSSFSNSSSRNSGEAGKTAAGSFDLSGGDLGPIPVFAQSPLLHSILKNIPKAVQRSWTQQWPGKENKIRRSLEKAYAFYSGNGGKLENVNWNFVLTKWLWNERDLRDQPPKPGEVFESNFQAFEAILKANNVNQISDLIGMLKEPA